MVASAYRREGDREHHTERILSRYASGSFLIDRLGAIGVVGQDLVVVLLDLRRRLIAEYGGSPAAMELIDRTVAAYQDFIRIAGWTANPALMFEHEFFGVDRLSADVLDLIEPMRIRELPEGSSPRTGNS